jgi:hypothetical protein
MVFKLMLFFWIFFLTSHSYLYPMSYKDQFLRSGYVEICDTKSGITAYEILYEAFDDLINFFQKNPEWAKKLYSVKERFIRSKSRDLYASDFFGFYDLEMFGRQQICFYYSELFHKFIFDNYPEFKQIPEFSQFLHTCKSIKSTYCSVFKETAHELGIEEVFSSNGGRLPILLKVVKYLPTYVAIKPHYDGTIFSVMLDSTDNQSFFLSPYKSVFVADDFFSPLRQFPRDKDCNSILIIPGQCLTDYLIPPTPHIVQSNGKTRYATIAFAMRPNFNPPKIEYSTLPSF